RNNISYETLERLLSASRYRVFDVNIREPYYDVDKIFSAMKKTELLKLNKHELATIIGWIGAAEAGEEKDKVRRLQDRFSIPYVIVTKGADGATYYEENASYESPVYKVEVADTVGSGDAFL